MAIPGPSTPQPSHSWRQVQSHLRNVVLSQPLRDVDSLLDVLLPTLHILDLVPYPPALPAHTAQRHTPQRVFGKLIHGRPLEDDVPLGGDAEGEDEEAWLRAFRSQAWLGDVQRSLLVGSIAETWDHEMKEREPEMWEALRRAWFVPRAAKEPAAAADSAPSSSNLIVMEGSEEQDAAQLARRRQSAAAMTLSGLQALSSALSTLAARTASSSTSSSSTRRPTDPLLSSTVQIAQWYATTPDLLNLLLEGTRMQGNAAKRSLVWGEVVKILASLQDRVANAAGSDNQQADVAGFARAWSKSLLSQLVGKLLAAEGDKADLPLLAELFTKLIRTNPQLLTASGSDDASQSFWPPLLRQLISLSSAPGLQLPPQVHQRWHLFLSHLDSRDRQNVDLSLAHFLHRRFLQIEVMDAAKERGRPAAVGKIFLSNETAQRVEMGARLLGVLWGSTAGPQSTREEEDSSDDDDDESEDHFSHLLTKIILSSHRSSSALLWSAGMARAFVCYVAGTSSSFSPAKASSSRTERLQAVLTRAIEQWGNADRIRRTTAQEEHYFVALILGVLAELRGSSNSAHPSQPGLATSRSPSFIQGVGSHLEHPDPEVRRMGMLLAEVVSEVAHSEQKQNEDGAKKPLSFGSSMWDGVGEGREEARVLRAAWHGWGMMRDGGRREVEGMRGERVLEMLGLKEQKETMIQQESAVATSKSASRQAPRTRQLPQRVPARRDGQGQDAEPQPKAGGRSLIVELDEDEGAAAGSSLRLNQVTSRGSKPRPLVSVESDNDDSSSESGSSSDEEAHEPPSIDADLTPGGSSHLPRAKKGPSAAAREDGQDELLGLGIDKKKRRPPPVYISDLTAMLRDHKERDSIRLALKHGEDLLRRKGQLAAAAASTSTSSTALASFSSLSLGAATLRGLRGEIDEHAIDLLLQLCALQNNYRIHSFEPRRRAMLRCLVVWSPRIAVPALVEQIFAPNYSITQRLGMLEALGLGARELCGCDGKGGQMKGWTDEAIGRARKEGEERVPEIKRERDLQRLTDVGAAAGRTRMLRRPQQEGGRAGIQEIGTSTNGQSTVQRLPSRYGTQRPATASGSSSTTPPLSSSLFIFPLLTRLRSHLSDASSRLSRARRITNLTHNSTNPSSLGLATPDLFTASPPLLLPAILDTLALLTATYVQEQRPTPLDAYGVVLPEMLEAATHVIREGLPLLAFAATDDQQGQGGKGGGGGEGSGNVVAAIASLILVTLDLALESPSAEASRLLVATERGAAALDDALRFASGVFESEDAKGGLGGGTGVGMGISRTGRICAAIVVRIEELRQRERERWLGGLGTK